MKNKKLLYPIISFVVGCFILAVGLLVDPSLYQSLVHTSKDLKYVSGYIDEFAWSLAISLRLLGAAVTIVSFLGFVFHKRLDGVCTVKTSAVAVGISGFSGSGVFSALGMFVFAAIGTKQYPLQSRAIGIGACISMLGFIILLWLYMFLRSKNKSKKGVIFDAVTAVSLVPGFYYLTAAMLSYLIAMFSGRTY